TVLLMNHGFRFDIQALRAVSVLLVLIFHVWPEALPAGYVGVDVFFVISGFLITAMLFRELQRDGRIGFIRFYMRRFRRLMPAASLVIVVTMLLSFTLEPGFRQPDTALEGIASALYWQNWLLAWRSTDYLASENALGPLTHYWSLSIEEQFYLVWPLALAAAGALAYRRGWSPRLIAIGVIGLISASSLIASAVLAEQNPAEVYFVTHTRIWELGLGALLALAPTPRIQPNRARFFCASALGVIIASAFLIPESAAFPGLVALVPTLAAALFIYAGAYLHGRVWFGLPRSRPVQMIGDASYSIYLWHWPLIYFATLGQIHSPGLGIGLALIVVSLLAGWLSWLFVEEPFRHRRDGKGLHAPVAVTATAAGLAVSIAGAGILYAHARTVIDSWNGLTPGNDYPGALMLSGNAPTPPQREPMPPLAALKEDLSVIYSNGCHGNPRAETPHVCELEPAAENAPVIVIVGDSHAANWVPALRAAASQAGWRLFSITKSACSLALESGGTNVRVQDHCAIWSRNVLERLRERSPDLVLLGRSRRNSDFISEQSDRWVNGLVPMLQSILAQLDSIADHVAVLSDTPRIPFDPAYCLAGESECSASLAESLDRPDALIAAAEQVPGIGIFDLREYVCPLDQCPAVIGNIVVWRDDHHLTATYSRSLAPEMIRLISELKDYQ
ncbi:MAG: acyltransferase family protein, partial [Wenzhouxiangellaceae bacterium]